MWTGVIPIWIFLNCPGAGRFQYSEINANLIIAISVSVKLCGALGGTFEL